MNFITTFESLREVELEVDEAADVFPEQKLMAAIIMTLLEDYELCLKRLCGQRSAPVQLKWSRESMNREAHSKYFETMCDYVGVDAHHIQRKLRQIDQKYPHNVTEWTAIECGLEYHERKERAANLPPGR